MNLPRTNRPVYPNTVYRTGFAQIPTRTAPFGPFGPFGSGSGWATPPIQTIPLQALPLRPVFPQASFPQASIRVGQAGDQGGLGSQLVAALTSPQASLDQGTEVTLQARIQQLASLVWNDAGTLEGLASLLDAIRRSSPDLQNSRALALGAMLVRRRASQISPPVSAEGAPGAGPNPA